MDIKYVDEDFFVALDKFSDENLKYWDMCVIEELKNYHDVHPAFVMDEKEGCCGASQQ